jgi:hypothetical protein
MDHEAVVTSEVILNGDFYAIWDFSVSWREPDVTFEAFVQLTMIWSRLCANGIDKRRINLQRAGSLAFLGLAARGRIASSEMAKFIPEMAAISTRAEFE